MKLNRVILLNSGARSQAAAAIGTNKVATAALIEAEQQLRRLQADCRQALHPTARSSPRGRTPHSAEAGHAARRSSRLGRLRWARLPLLAACVAGLTHGALAFLDKVVQEGFGEGQNRQTTLEAVGEAPLPSPASGPAAPEQPVETSPYAGRFASLPSRERDCLLRAIYYEARHEPVAGQIAVAQVVLNRVMAGRWPKTVCGVVNQGHERGHSCQFSFACHRYSRASPKGEAWTRSGIVADEVAKGSAWLPELVQSTHYHRFDVSPVWREKLPVIGRIGAHVFYGDEGRKVVPLPAMIASSEPQAGVADDMAEPASRPPLGSAPRRPRRQNP